MAKKNESAEKDETKRSIGSQMKSGLTQRERNLKVKQEMIDRGERPFPNSLARTVKEKNLEVKKKKPSDKDGKGKK